jgi:hypothetical protein
MNISMNQNFKCLLTLVSGLLGGVAYGQELTLPRVEVLGDVLKPTNQGSAEAAYRVESVNSLGPLGRANLLDTPNSMPFFPRP